MADTGILLIIIVGGALVVFWVWQFILLMLSRDDEFPGRNDKLIWVVVFLLLVPLAPLAYYFFRQALTVRQAVQDERLRLLDVRDSARAQVDARKSETGDGEKSKPKPGKGAG